MVHIKQLKVMHDFDVVHSLVTPVILISYSTMILDFMSDTLTHVTDNCKSSRTESIFRQGKYLTSPIYADAVIDETEPNIVKCTIPRFCNPVNAELPTVSLAPVVRKHIRICSDYRELNTKPVKDAYPLLLPY